MTELDIDCPGAHVTKRYRPAPAGSDGVLGDHTVNKYASSLFGVGSEKALSRRGFRVDEGSMDCGAGLFGVERVVAESSARRWKYGNRA